jgi:hypothetical protein
VGSQAAIDGLRLILLADSIAGVVPRTPNRCAVAILEKIQSAQAHPGLPGHPHHFRFSSV